MIVKEFTGNETAGVLVETKIGGLTASRQVCFEVTAEEVCKEIVGRVASFGRTYDIFDIKSNCRFYTVMVYGSFEKYMAIGFSTQWGSIGEEILRCVTNRSEEVL